MDRPISAWWCRLGWFAATAVFIGVTRLLGGPTQFDTPLSAYATWAIAHGVPSCAYPPTTFSGVAPLYPLISGGFAAMTRIGHSVPFPSQAALGPHCSTAIAAVSRWSIRSGAIVPTMRLGFLGWLVLMAGLVALLRTSGRGRCRWEPTVLILVAWVPVIAMPLQEFFHPEDLMAMGFSLGCLACVRRGLWFWAGVLIGLAIASQQFALLFLAPLMMVPSWNRRFRLVGAAIGTVAVIVVPLIVITSGGVTRAVTGAAATPSAGRTVLSAMHLHGPVLFALSRVLPIVLALALAAWAVRRFGQTVVEPLLLVSLIATSLTFRLVFEVNLYGYYFMAVALLLIVLDILRGRIRMYLVAWLILVSLAFMPLPWGYDPWGNGLPIWLWQILLVPSALGLALGPLISAADVPTCSESCVHAPQRMRLDKTTPLGSRLMSGRIEQVHSGT